VNLVTAYLSSVQVAGEIDMLNHYWFSDVLSGVNIPYPLTATGNLFTTPSWPATANGGQFFPWGYAYQDSYNYAYLGKYKGYTTVTFCGTGLNINFFPILKILYSFDDGDTYENNRAILIDYSKLKIDSLLNGAGYGDPKYINVDHTYEPSDSTFTTPYTAYIQVLNGNLATNHWYFTIDIVQDSIFDFNDFNLLESKFISLSNKTESNIVNVIEASDPEYILNNLIKISSS